MFGRWLSPSRPFPLPIVLLACLTGIIALRAQSASPGLTVWAREGKRTVAVTQAGGRDLVALDDLASLFQLIVRDERGAVTVSYKGRTIVLTPDQTMASVSGRLVSLTAPPTHVAGRWLVPLDFINRALAPVYDAPLDLRRASRLLVVGNLRVPRIIVGHDAAGSVARLVFDIQPRTDASVSPDGSARLVVKFDADAVDAVLPAGAPPPIVQGVRVVEPASFVIDLSGGFRTFRSSMQPADSGSRLVLEVLSSQPDAAPPVSVAEPAPRLPDQPAPSFGTAGIRTLAIDAGHGGDDVGARSADGILEKDVTLAVARRLRALVESRLGMRVLMTRDDDQAVRVAERTALANNNKADVFISLHANASFRPAVSGASVIVASFPADVVTELRAPTRLPAVGGGMRDIELVPWNLAQIRHRDRSDGFARLLVAQLDGRVALAPASIEYAPLRVLESANMTAILVELGYLTNPEQARQLAGADFQNTVASSIADALARFRDGSSAGEGAGR